MPPVPAPAPATVAPRPVVQAEDDTSWLPWAGLAALGALAAAFAFTRRRRTDVDPVVEETSVEEYAPAEEPMAADAVVMDHDGAEQVFVTHETVDAGFAEDAPAAAEEALPELILDDPVIVTDEGVQETAAFVESPSDFADGSEFEVDGTGLVAGAGLAAGSDAEVGAAEPAAFAPVTDTAAARPRIALTFKPAAASATDDQATVQFVLTVANLGDVPARRVRFEARMIAMGEDHDAALAAFFAEPLTKATPIASAIPPAVSTDLRTQVTLPRSAVRPIRHADRMLFVPVVAINVLYEWDGGQDGQTAMSYVIGRENRPPAAKMAPFRLDQGPRIYREVGHRVHELRRVA